MTEVSWPSARKLARLRKEGIVPVSTISIRLVVVLVVVAIAWSEGGNLLSLVTYDRLLRMDGGDSVQALSRELAWELTLMLGSIVGALVSIVLVFALLQTRFFLSPGLCSLQPGRLWPRLNSLKLVRSFVRVFFCMFISAIVYLIVFYALVPDLAVGFSMTAREMLEIDRYSLELPFMLMSLLAVLSLIVAAVNRLYFMWFHRMSRQEQEAEARER